MMPPICRFRLLFLCAALFITGPLHAAEALPNIVYVLADDLGLAM